MKTKILKLLVLVAATSSVAHAQTDSTLIYETFSAFDHTTMVLNSPNAKYFSFAPQLGFLSGIFQIRSSGKVTINVDSVLKDFRTDFKDLEWTISVIPAGSNKHFYINGAVAYTNNGGSSAEFTNPIDSGFPAEVSNQNVSGSGTSYMVVHTYYIKITGKLIDKISPVLTLKGKQYDTVFVNSTYTDSGATAVDNIDGNLTDSIKVMGTVNTSIVGNHTLTYTVKDIAGNVASKNRIVTVAFHTNVKEQEIENVRVFYAGAVIIDNPLNKPLMVSIYNSIGQEIHLGSFGDPIPTLPSGIYLLHLTDTKTKETCWKRIAAW